METNQNTVYWVDINLALKKGLKFYQPRSNAIILHETLPAYCIPKVVRLEIGEVIYEKVYASPRSPPKISFKHDWMKELGSEVVRQREGEVAQQSICSQSSPPNPNPDHDRTWKPVVCRDTSHAQGASQTRSSHESTNFNVEDETNHDRTRKPVVCRDANHEQSMLYVADIDFRIPGLPHSVVKQTENCRVRELVKKIEKHLHRETLQRDLQLNKAYNPPKKMIQDMGNLELFELFETDPKTQCKECLSYWSEGVVYCTCGHLLKESEANRGVIQYTLDLLSIPDYVIQNGRPHGHRYGKTPQKKEYHQAHNLKRDVSRSVPKESTIAFWKIFNFVHPSSNMMEMKFISKWMILQTRIPLFKWRNQNIFDTNRIGGSLSRSLETLDHWEIVPTSTKRCLQ